MENQSTAFARLKQTRGAFVEDRHMASALESLANELRADEAMLAVAITGAKAPAEPWKNPELVTSLQSLIATGRAIEGVPLELVADYEAVLGSGDDALSEMGARLRKLAAIARDATTAEVIAIGQEAQETLLKAAEGFWDERAAKRLSKYVEVVQLPQNGVYDRATSVLALDAALVRALAARDLYNRIMTNTADRQLAKQVENEVMEIEEAELDAETVDDGIYDPPPASNSRFDFGDRYAADAIDDLDVTTIIEPVVEADIDDTIDMDASTLVADGEAIEAQEPIEEVTVLEEVVDNGAVEFVDGEDD